MRFVTWNCNEGFDRDVERLRDLGCDYAVLEEVPRRGARPSLLHPDIDWHWNGDPDWPRRGVAVASFDGPLRKHEVRSNSGRYAVAAETEEGVGLLGLWACPPKGQSLYGPVVVEAIDAYGEWLAETPSIVAGDLNISPGTGGEDERHGSLRMIFDRLRDLGYTSAYHHYSGETYGEETQHTYFHWRHEDKRFHIDFVFLHDSLLSSIRTVTVGTHADWVAGSDGQSGSSDHVPLIVELDL